MDKCTRSQNDKIDQHSLFSILPMPVVNRLMLSWADFLYSNKRHHKQDITALLLFLSLQLQGNPEGQRCPLPGVALMKQRGKHSDSFPRTTILGSYQHSLRQYCGVHLLWFWLYGASSGFSVKVLISIMQYDFSLFLPAPPPFSYSCPLGISSDTRPNN